MRSAPGVLITGLLLAQTGLLAQLQLGDEVLATGGFRELQGKRVGLITNPSGVNHLGHT